MVDEATHQHLAAKTTELEQRLRDIATRFGAARFDVFTQFLLMFIKI